VQVYMRHVSWHCGWLISGGLLVSIAYSHRAGMCCQVVEVWVDTAPFRLMCARLLKSLAAWHVHVLGGGGGG
jgi:hypothetical protein